MTHQEKLEKFYHAYMELSPAHTMQLAHELHNHLDKLVCEDIPPSISPVTLQYAVYQSLENIGVQLWLDGSWCNEQLTETQLGSPMNTSIHLVEDSA